MAVENSRTWHEENIKANKGHYTLFARSTSGRVVHAIQQYGARMHFNHMKLGDCEQIRSLNGGQACPVKIRYGIINLDDMLRDLQHWETLLTSSFM